MVCPLAAVLAGVVGATVAAARRRYRPLLDVVDLRAQATGGSYPEVEVAAKDRRFRSAGHPRQPGHDRAVGERRPQPARASRPVPRRTRTSATPFGVDRRPLSPAGDVRGSASTLPGVYRLLLLATRLEERSG